MDRPPAGPHVDDERKHYARWPRSADDRHLDAMNEEIDATNRTENGQSPSASEGTA
jgi:hypothetical protein